MQEDTERSSTPVSASRDVAFELGARRTGMAFQRTRLSADRTLMSAIRTSLSLISFGFTIAKAFQQLHEAHVWSHSKSPRHFGEALVLLGITLLVLGIGYHLAFMRGLRLEREQLCIRGLLYAESSFPISMTLIVALLLLLIGAFAVCGLLFDFGPLSS